MSEDPARASWRGHNQARMPRASYSSSFYLQRLVAGLRREPDVGA